MPVLKNIGVLATCPDDADQANLGEIRAAAVAFQDGVIRWAGAETDLPDTYCDEEAWDAGGGLVLPGLIDCHTHLAFGGWRADEFEMRLRGRGYLEIAKAGGGILSTVRATRQMSEEQLAARCEGFLREMSALGVTTVECKSGYGLDRDTELAVLRAYARLAASQPLGIVPTFLGAHTIPPEYADDHEGYIRLLIDEVIPEVAEQRLARFCDVYIEESAFTVDEAERILEAGKHHGFDAKVHIGQFTDCGGALLAARLGVASADHLEHVSDVGIAAMGAAGVTAVVLPLASLYTRQEPANARRLVDGGVAVAVSTDFNPGSAPSYDLSLALMLACTRGQMTPAEAVKGATVYAARAIGEGGSLGSVEVGKAADLCVIDAPSVNHWLYHYRPNACRMTIKGGARIYERWGA